MKKKNKSEDKYLLNQIKKEQQKRFETQSSGRRDKEPNLLNISNALDEYYFLEKLKIYCSFLSYRLMVNNVVIGYEEKDFLLIPEIIDLTNKKEDTSPELSIYYNIYLLFKQALPSSATPDSQDIFNFFVETESLINKSKNDIASADLVNIYSHLTNFATYQINNDRNEFIIKNIIHYQNILDSKTNEIDEELSPRIFKNMVVLILKIKEIQDKGDAVIPLPPPYKSVYDWAHQFVQKYGIRLPIISRENYTSYCKALILFRQGEIKQAYQLIKKLERIREMFFNLDVKVLQLQVFLELEIKEERFFVQEDIELEEEIEKLRNTLRYDKNQQPKLAYQSGYYWEFLHLYKRFYTFFNKFGWMYQFGDETYHHKRDELKQLILLNQHSYQYWFMELLDIIK